MPSRFCDLCVTVTSSAHKICDWCGRLMMVMDVEEGWSSSWKEVVGMLARNGATRNAKSEYDLRTSTRRKRSQRNADFETRLPKCPRRKGRIKSVVELPQRPTTLVTQPSQSVSRDFGCNPGIAGRRTQYYLLFYLRSAQTISTSFFPRA